MILNLGTYNDTSHHIVTTSKLRKIFYENLCTFPSERNSRINKSAELSFLKMFYHLAWLAFELQYFAQRNDNGVTSRIKRSKSIEIVQYRKVLWHFYSKIY